MKSYHDLSTPPGFLNENLLNSTLSSACQSMSFSTLSYMCMAAITLCAAISQGIACMACGISSL
ncbi:MAG: hypothetical protein ACOYT8_03595 [Candidatus Dependentiae bacterium]